MSRFLNKLVSLPGLRHVFRTGPGTRVLHGWNTFWLGAARSTRVLRNKIPGRVDDVFLKPLETSFIWLDPIVEVKTKSGDKKFEIVKNPLVHGRIIIDKVTGEVKEGSLRFKNIYSSDIELIGFNDHELNLVWWKKKSEKDLHSHHKTISKRLSNHWPVRDRSLRFSFDLFSKMDKLGLKSKEELVTFIERHITIIPGSPLEQELKRSLKKQREKLGLG